MKQIKKIAGQKLSHLCTIGSRYANGYLICRATINGKDEACRIHVSTLRVMLSDYIFEIFKGDKRFKSIHLINPQQIPENESEASELVKQGLF